MFPLHPQDLARMQAIEADIALQTGKPTATLVHKGASSEGGPSVDLSTQNVPMQAYPLFMSSAPTANVSFMLGMIAS